MATGKGSDAGLRVDVLVLAWLLVASSVAGANGVAVAGSATDAEIEDLVAEEPVAEEPIAKSQLPAESGDEDARSVDGATEVIGATGVIGVIGVTNDPAGVRANANTQSDTTNDARSTNDAQSTNDARFTTTAEPGPPPDAEAASPACERLGLSNPSTDRVTFTVTAESGLTSVVILNPGQEETFSLPPGEYRIQAKAGGLVGPARPATVDGEQIVTLTVEACPTPTAAEETTTTETTEATPTTTTEATATITTEEPVTTEATATTTAETTAIATTTATTTTEITTEETTSIETTIPTSIETTIPTPAESPNPIAGFPRCDDDEIGLEAVLNLTVEDGEFVADDADNLGENRFEFTTEGETLMYELELVSVERNEAGEPVAVTFESSLLVEAVIVRGGPGANVYRFPDGVAQRADLRAPTPGDASRSFAIDGVTFCYDPEPPNRAADAAGGR